MQPCTRHDRLVHWIDRWARRVAAPAAPGVGGAHHSRREFLRRAATVGVVAWSIPVLQTVVAPAASASGCSQGICGTGAGCPLCEVGTPCLVGAECVTLRCSGGVCQPGQAGDTCDSNDDCVTNICSGGTCQPGGIGTPCVTDAECTAGECSGRSGGALTCGGPGSACNAGSDCTYGNCGANDICGGRFATCSTATVCSTGRRCTFLGCLALGA
jgi:hypothetical protein